MAIVNGYTTLDRLKERLSVSDTEDDAELERIITAVSRVIDDYTGRRFYATTETRYYTARRADRLLVDDLLTVTSLATDADGDRTYEDTWASTDYDLGPDNEALEGRPYWEVAITPNGNLAFPVGVRRGVKIVGSFGFSASTPAVVEQECLEQCATEWQVRGGARVVGNSEVGTVQINLHPRVRRNLDPFREIRVG